MVPPRRLASPVDAASRVVFRAGLGAVLAWQAIRLWSGLEGLYLAPPVHYAYPGFGWLRPLPLPGLRGLVVVLALCGGAVALGRGARVAALGWGLGFGYLFLLDRALYQNHYYLLLLLCGIVAASPGPRDGAVPAWSLGLLRFQVGAVYVGGGIAKLGPDWLAGWPLRGWLLGPVAGGAPAWLAGEASVAFFACGGLAFDLAVVPLLLVRRTRPLAVVASLFFHLTNAWLFRIGVFPWLMLLATTLFFEPGWPRRLAPLARWLPPSPPPLRPDDEPGASSRRLRAALVVWVALQVALPLRHLALPGDVNWTQEGQLFAWRMKLTDKRGSVGFVALHPDLPRPRAIDPRRRLPRHLVQLLAIEPEFQRQYAHHLAAELGSAGLPGAEVRAVGAASLNFREPRRLVDPRVDLAAEPWRPGAAPWILPNDAPPPDPDAVRAGLPAALVGASPGRATSVPPSAPPRGP